MHYDYYLAATLLAASLMEPSPRYSYTSPLLLMASSTCGEGARLMITRSRSSPHCWSAGTPSPPQDHLPLDCMVVPVHQQDSISTTAVVDAGTELQVIACCSRIFVGTIKYLFKVPKQN